MRNTAELSYNQKVNKWQAIFNNEVIVQGGTRDYVKTAIESGLNKKAKRLGITKVSIDGLHFGDLPSSEVMVPEVEEFGINERFEFVDETVQMIIDGIIPSVILSGSGGLGKTFQVMKTIKNNGLEDIREVLQPTVNEDGEDDFISEVLGDYITIKGYSTARGLFRTLYENSNKLIIFDDTDSILRDVVAINLLKSALDSYDRRVISWNSENPNSDLPRSFLFIGRVIFISNLPLSKIDQPILSRSISIDLSMTIDQKIERMRTIIDGDEFLPEISKEMKLEALALIDENKANTKELSMRTLISVSKIRAGDKHDWKRLAKYILVNN